MELYSLQVFSTVVAERSFSRAAEKLYRSQPAISLSLQRLEAELGQKLIDRAGKALVLTDAGRTVLEYARRFDNLRPEMTDALAFVVSPKHRFGKRRTVSISELGMETFIAHNVVSPYREVVLREFRRHKVPLNMDVEMPTLETIRKLVQSNEGVAFLPRMCVRQDIESGTVREVNVKELHVE